MPDRQIQRGSAGQQLQAGRDIHLVTGLTVEVAREIIDAKAEVLRREFSDHAQELVAYRLEQFERLLLYKFSNANLLSAFADPDFQFNVLEAQRSAARSGSEDDLGLLVDLLAQRAGATPTPRMKLATRRALDMVGQVSHESLVGLTVLWYGVSLSPMSDSLDQALHAMEQHLSPLVDAGLPTDQRWMTDLAILDCIQLSVGGLGQLKAFQQLLVEHKFPGFTARGFDAQTADGFKAALEKVHVGLGDLITPHRLSPDRFCLAGKSEERFREIVSEVSSATSPGADFLTIVNEAIAQNQYDQRAPECEEGLQRLLSNHAALPAVNEWWKTFPAAEITPVGVALAYANLKRLLPEVQFVSIDSLF